MQLVDTHTHIYSEDFDVDIDAVLQRAADSAVSKMVLPNVDRDSFPRMMSLATAHPGVLYACTGLHPTSVGEDYREQLAFVEQTLQQGAERFVAIGEIGLDYYWDTTFAQEQAEAFRTQLEWSLHYDLPVILHTRDAFADTFMMLREVNSSGLRGVFHSFTGTPEELDEALSFPSFMIGLNGVVTFKNSTLRDYVGRIPLDRLLIETDAPYLSPVPKRGKRNEPAFMVHTFEFLASLYGLAPNELAQITTANAQRLFAI